MPLVELSSHIINLFKNLLSSFSKLSVATGMKTTHTNTHTHTHTHSTHTQSHTHTHTHTHTTHTHTLMHENIKI